MSIVALGVVTATTEEEHSILLPAAYDILWGTVSFVLLFILFKKYVLPALTKVMAERDEKIKGGIARAQAMQEEAAKTKAEYQARLAAAAQEAASIRTSAQGEGEQIVSDARNQATEVAAGITSRADAQIAADRDAAVGALRTQVGDLAVTLASKIVGESLSDDRRAKATVDRFIADLEAAAAAGSGK